jgi:hypothetical protein
VTDDRAPDDGLAAVHRDLVARPRLRELFAAAFRTAFDEVLDGQRTGRFDVRTLAKTEKTYIGTKVEIVLGSALSLAPGSLLDYSIAGEEVDCKFSVDEAQVMIPSEALGQICLVTWADDFEGLFSVGLVRPTHELLTAGNRDGKRHFGRAGRESIRWIFRRQPFPENLLLKLSPETRARIFAVVGRGGGQQRINELFRLVQGRPISRSTILTVAQQDDGPKRARTAREHLAREGILVLGQYTWHRQVARDLGLPVPGRSQWLSVRVATARDPDTERVARIGHIAYRLARPDDPPELVVNPALPK